jgi:hypothetical protein
MFMSFNFQEAIGWLKQCLLCPDLASERCLFVWNLCKKVNGSFDLTSSVKYPFTLHSTFLWKGSLNCIVDLAQTYASFIVTPPRHVEAPGHEAGI